jgi:hypothetical protein
MPWAKKVCLYKIGWHRHIGVRPTPAVNDEDNQSHNRLAVLVDYATRDTAFAILTLATYSRLPDGGSRSVIVRLSDWALRLADAGCPSH